MAWACPLLRGFALRGFELSSEPESQQKQSAANNFCGITLTDSPRIFNLDLTR
jgi:hypothetical protein